MPAHNAESWKPAYNAESMESHSVQVTSMQVRNDVCWKGLCPATWLLAPLALLLSACGQRTAAPRQAPTVPEAPLGEPADPSFIGRVWQDTTPGSPRGSILIFLPDRTLVQDSCFEPFRLSKWGADGNLIRWQQDTLPVEAEISRPGPDELILKLRGQLREKSFVLASVPYVCPDMPSH